MELPLNSLIYLLANIKTVNECSLRAYFRRVSRGEASGCISQLCTEGRGQRQPAKRDLTGLGRTQQTLTLTWCPGLAGLAGLLLTLPCVTLSHQGLTLSNPLTEAWQLQRLTAWILESVKPHGSPKTPVIFYLLPVDHTLHPPPSPTQLPALWLPIG